MPGGDRRGPMGEGPMTGRGAGFCSGTGEPGYTAPSYGFGRGFGGRGRRRFFPFGYAARPRWGRAGGIAYLGPDDEVDSLKQEAGWLKQRMDEITKRLGEIEDKQVKLLSRWVECIV